MKKIEKMTVTVTNEEIVFKEPSEDNALERYNKELPQEFKKADFMKMSEYWQFRQVEAYCEFMKEVIPDNIKRATKCNTMLGCVLASIGFKPFSYNASFASTYQNYEKHDVKCNISFSFDYHFENNTTPKKQVELLGPQSNDDIVEDKEFERGNQIKNVWNSQDDVVQLAHKVFNDYPEISESNKLFICAAILNAIQNTIDLNATDSEIKSSGFTNDNLDKNSELAKQMECTNMTVSLNIESTKYIKKPKRLIH